MEDKTKDKMNEMIETAAMTAKILAGLGVGTMIGNACNMTIPADLGILRETGCKVAKWALIGTVSTATAKFIDEKAEWADNQIKDLSRRIHEKEKGTVKVEVKVEEEKPKKTSKKKSTKKKEPVETPKEEVEQTDSKSE